MPLSTEENLARKIRRNRFHAILVFLAGGLFTLLFWQSAAVQVDRIEQARFDHNAESIREAIVERLGNHVRALRGMQGLFGASEQVTRAEWRQYVRALTLEEFHGSLGFAFVRHVRREALDEFLAATRADGAPDFAVRSSGNYPDLAVVEFIEPLESNRSAQGYDIGQETVRRQALARSVELNRETLTARLTLVQDRQKHAGFLLMLPVYRQGLPLDSVEERWQALLGWVDTPILIDELLRGLALDLHDPMDLEIFDGLDEHFDSLLYDADDCLLTLPPGTLPAGNIMERTYFRQQPLDVADRQWIVRITSTPDFIRPFEHNLPIAFLIAGLLVSLLASRLTASYGKTLEEAELIARRMTLDLRQSEERYRTLIENQTDVVCRLRPDGTISFASDVFCRYFGMNCAELGGSPWQRLVLAEDQPLILEGLSTLTPERPVTTVELRVLSGSGETRWLQFVNHGSFDDARNLQEILAVGRDVTERKTMQKALEERDEQLRIIFDTSRAGIIMVGPDSRIMVANQRMVEMFGYPAEELSGMSYPELVCSEERAGTYDRLRLMIGGEPDYLTAERHYQRKDGSKFWGHLSARRYVDTEGELIALIGVISDATELKDLEYQAMRTAQLAAVGELASGVAHEINNPINGIINYAQLLLNSGSQADPDCDLLRRIIKEGDRIALIVRDLLFFARDSGAHTSVISVQRTLDTVLNLAGKQLEKEGVEVALDLAGEELDLLVNPQQIEQVWLNLISNARHALHERHGRDGQPKRLEIALRQVAKQGQEFCRVSFRDNGAGIPEQLLGEITKPFVTTKPAGVGTGLGLSISHEIVSRFGGTLSISSLEGEFTQVTVDLPLHRPDEPETPA